MISFFFFLICKIIPSPDVSVVTFSKEQWELSYDDNI